MPTIYENTVPVKIQPINPPIKPSSVLLGLIDGTILRLPKARPEKYAKVSLAQVVNNNNQSVIVPQLYNSKGIDKFM